MKIALDPIYTNDPTHCASNVKMRKIVEYILARRNDVYFYWLIPEGLTPEELAFYPKSERVELFPYGYSTDRMREYIRVKKEYEDLFAFTGKLWDVDVFVTNRTSLVPFLKAMTNKPNVFSLEWAKKVFLLEDMPIMGFKKHVGFSNVRAQEMMTLAGYVCADRICISAFWEKELILQEGKKYLSPASLQHIQETMIEASAVHVDKPILKTRASVERMLSGERPFTIAFIGRMTHNSRAEDIFDLIGKHWIIRGKNKIRGFISTQSKRVGRVNVPDWMKMHRLPREGFWELVKNEIDTYVFLSPEEDYSMSCLEPLILGCPAVLLKCRWSVPTVGPNYPFFVNNDMEAYGMVKALYDDYAGMYQKFAVWQQSEFADIMFKRNAVYIPKLLNEYLPEWEKDFEAWQKKYPWAPHNQVVKLIVEWEQSRGDDQPFTILAAIEALGKQGKLDHLALKLNESFKDKIKLVWQTDWNCYRLALMGLGYVDAGTPVGMMRKEKK